MLLPEGTSATREGIQQCLDQLDLKADGYQVGKTKVILLPSFLQIFYISLKTVEAISDVCYIFCVRIHDMRVIH